MKHLVSSVQIDGKNNMLLLIMDTTDNWS